MTSADNISVPSVGVSFSHSDMPIRDNPLLISQYLLDFCKQDPVMIQRGTAICCLAACVK